MAHRQFAAFGRGPDLSDRSAFRHGENPRRSGEVRAVAPVSMVSRDPGPHPKVAAHPLCSSSALEPGLPPPTVQGPAPRRRPSLRRFPSARRGWRRRKLWYGRAVPRARVGASVEEIRAPAAAATRISAIRASCCSKSKSRPSARPKCRSRPPLPACPPPQHRPSHGHVVAVSMSATVAARAPMTPGTPAPQVDRGGSGRSPSRRHPMFEGLAQVAARPAARASCLSGDDRRSPGSARSMETRPPARRSRPRSARRRRGRRRRSSWRTARAGATDRRATRRSDRRNGRRR